MSSSMTTTTSIPNLVHLFAHSAYEELQRLEHECGKPSAPDVKRKRLIAEYCDRQRHRVLQLLALLSWADADLQMLTQVTQAVGAPVTSRLRQVQLALMHTRDSGRVVHTAKAPRFDLQGALDVLYRGTMPLPGVLHDLAFEGANEEEGPPVDLIYDMILSNETNEDLFAHEDFISMTDSLLHVHLPRAFSVHLAVTPTREWVVHDAKVFCAPSPKAFSSAAWVDDDAHEALLNVLDSIAAGPLRLFRLLHTFTANLAIQILRSQSPSVDSTNEARLRLALWPNKPDIIVEVRPATSSPPSLLLLEAVLDDVPLKHVDLDPSSLDCAVVISAARSEWARRMLALVRKHVRYPCKMHSHKLVVGKVLAVSIDVSNGAWRLRPETEDVVVAKVWGPHTLQQRVEMTASLMAKCKQVEDVAKLISDWVEECLVWNSLAMRCGGGMSGSLVAPLASLIANMDPCAYEWLGKFEAKNYWAVKGMDASSIRVVATDFEGKVVAEDVVAREEDVRSKIMAMRAKGVEGVRFMHAGGFVVLCPPEEVECLDPDVDVKTMSARVGRAWKALGLLRAMKQLPAGVSRTKEDTYRFAHESSAELRFTLARGVEAVSGLAVMMEHAGMVWEWMVMEEGNVVQGLEWIRDVARLVAGVKGIHVGAIKPWAVHVVLVGGKAFTCVFSSQQQQKKLEVKSASSAEMEACTTMDQLMALLMME
jgi:hypothetical protein